MTDFKVEKPVIFISHASSDKQIVEILKTQIDKVFANGVDVFASSVLGVISPSSDWLKKVNENLSVAKVVIVLITPVSINRPWVWFELGATWAKRDEGKLKIYPVYVPEIQPNELPRPLSDIQATPLGSANHVKLLFEDLCELFGIGNMKTFKGSSISQRLPKYSDVKVDPKDLESGTLYSGPYEGYRDAELEEILIEEYLYPAYSDFRGVTPGFILEPFYGDTPIVPLLKGIFRGELIHYRKLDNQLNLPPNTSSRLLKQTAKKFGLIPLPDKDFDNSVRFRYDKDLDSYRADDTKPQTRKRKAKDIE